MIDGLYWKITGVLLILGSIMFGLLIPLRPGIIDRSVLNAQESDTVDMVVDFYNMYKEEVSSDDILAWLKIDSPQQLLASVDQEWVAPSRLRLQFYIPQIDFQGKEVQEASLLVSSSKEGYSILPSALFVKADSLPFSGQYAMADVNISRKEGIYFPFRNILVESIRNTYYHIPLWFAMIVILSFAAWYSVMYIRTEDLQYDSRAQAYSEVGLLLGILGLLTGAIWARFTWGAFWSWDVKQFTSAVALLIYFAYFLLRTSVPEWKKRARLSSSYNIFAFIMLIPLLFIVPRMTDSLHPGSGGNPAMGGEDLDYTMRLIFYPAIIGWILFSFWMASLRRRILSLKLVNELYI